MSHGDFCCGIGLAGGIDKDGRRAGELLAAGFASVEFGSVAAGIDGHPDSSAAALAANLAACRVADETRIGVGIGRPPGAPPETLPACWLAGLEAVAGVADYVSFNLSAAANRPLLAADQRGLLARSFAVVAGWRDAVAASGGRRLRLALKFPLGARGEPLSTVGLLAVAAGFEQLTAVRADDAPDFNRLHALARLLGDGPALVAVGGIRGAADIAAARAAGAAGVQVHRAFVEHGAACLGRLRGTG